MDELKFKLFLFGGLIIVLAGWFFLWLLPKEKKRSKQLQFAAETMGANYQANLDALPRNFASDLLLLFSIPSQCSFSNIIRLEKNKIHIFVADHRQNILHEKDILQTVVILRIDNAKIPRFALVPHKQKDERFTMRFRTFVIEQTAQLHKGYKKLSGFKIEGYDLKAPEEDYAKVNELFSVMAEKVALMEKWCVEGSGELLLVYQRERLATPSNLQGFINQAMEVANLFEFIRLTEID